MRTEPNVVRQMSPERRPVAHGALSKFVTAYGLILGIVAIWLGFGLSTRGLFLSAGNLAILANQMAITGVASVGVTLLIIMGEFDLSVGGAEAVATSILGILLINDRLNIWIGMILVLLLGAAFGMLQGAVIVQLTRLKFRVASFVVTLGSMLALQGLALLVLPEPLGPAPALIISVGTGTLGSLPSMVLLGALIAGVLLQMAHRNRHSELAPPSSDVRRNSVLVLLSLGLLSYVAMSQGIPVLLIITLLLTVILEVLTQMTVFGRHMYAIGGNRETARLMGIRIYHNIWAAYAIVGIVYGVLGILSAARLEGFVPTVGATLPLEAIAAAAIGGVSLVGGRGRPYQALLGAVIVASLANGLAILAVPSLWQNITTGIVLVLAVFMDLVTKRRKEEADGV